jgi:hypothetical protein
MSRRRRRRPITAAASRRASRADRSRRRRRHVRVLRSAERLDSHCLASSSCCVSFVRHRVAALSFRCVHSRCFRSRRTRAHSFHHHLEHTQRATRSMAGDVPMPHDEDDPNDVKYVNCRQISFDLISLFVRSLVVRFCKQRPTPTSSKATTTNANAISSGTEKPTQSTSTASALSAATTQQQQQQQQPTSSTSASSVPATLAAATSSGGGASNRRLLTIGTNAHGIRRENKSQQERRVG